MRTGNEESTIIGRDPWLPGQDNHKVLSIISQELAFSTVSRSIKQDHKEWDIELVFTMFDGEEARDGNFTIKSAYKKILSMKLQKSNHPVAEEFTTVWRRIWSLNIPPKYAFFVEMLQGYIYSQQIVPLSGDE
ncbi:hypothetical protein L6164_033280 [Bauhinia variegata]|uniref:Uncharacterized protein n=1 Tax=Bauhinia variegata TaxID=167791 RepID=A0ACB9KRE2_BAUVA|nr:hypothetical protein L6164_033280 [Bauhinia variegata]